MPTLAAPASTLTPAAVERFDRDGFTVVPHLLTAAESAGYRAAALAFADAHQKVEQGQVFRQLCNVHPRDAVLKTLTFHPQVVAAVAELSGGRSMRLYHDQILVKDPKNGQASEFHQDRPYWPLEPGHTVSIWIALDDATRERGCMSFIPGSHRHTGTPLQVISWANDLFEKCPPLKWYEQVVAPLQSGGATFHQGWTAHRAGPNESDIPRVAFSAIFVESSTRSKSPLSWLKPGHDSLEMPEDPCVRIC